MLDFLKLSSTQIDQSELLKNHLVGFIGNYDCDTSEEVGGKCGEYQDMKFKLFKGGYTEIHGSLHKFKNQGYHNFDDFTHKQLVERINRFEHMFHIDASLLKIDNLEVGVNIVPPIPTKKLLRGLIMHHGELFKNVSLKSGDYRQARKQRYIIKAYNKSMQYKALHNIPRDLFRFERKQIKMIDLKRCSIHTLADLKTDHWIRPLGEILLNDWNKVLFFDPSIRKNELKAYQRTVKLSEWSNPNWWDGLKKTERSRQLQKYNQIVENHSDKVHSKIGALIKSKWETLAKDVYQLTGSYS